MKFVTYDIVTPASLDQGSRITVVQNFALSLEVAIGRYGLGCKVEPVLSFNAVRPLCFVIGVDACWVYVSGSLPIDESF